MFFQNNYKKHFRVIKTLKEVYTMKQKVILVCMLVLISLIGVFAQEEAVAVPISAEVQGEQLNSIELVQRMLLANIERSLIGMSTVIEQASDELDVQRLESLQEQLSQLQAELEDAELTQRSQVIDYRTQATQIVTQFREESHSLFAQERRAELQRVIEERRLAQAELQERIREHRELIQQRNEAVLQQVRERVESQVGSEQAAQRVMQSVNTTRLTRESVTQLREVVVQELREIPAELRRLRQALVDGVITQEEFNERYREFMAQQSSNVVDSQRPQQIPPQRPEVTQDDELTRLRQALADGIITQEEFDVRYEQLLETQQQDTNTVDSQEQRESQDRVISTDETQREQEQRETDVIQVEESRDAESTTVITRGER